MSTLMDEIDNSEPIDITIVPDTFQPIRYGVQETFLRTLAEQYQPLEIAGVDDKAGFKRVHEARMELRGLRTDIDRRRKELKADALEWGKRVDDEAKRLTALIEPVETALKEKEDAVKAEAERLKRERIETRMRALAAVSLPGTLPPESMVDAWSDDEFEVSLQVATREHEKRQAEEKARQEREAAERAELERLRREESERQAAETKRLAEERAELDRQRAELTAQQQAIKAQQEAAEAAERQRLAAIERERLQAEAAERARIETEARLKREAEEAEAARLAAESEAARQAALRPDREKLASVADLIEAIEVPEVSDDLNGLREEIIEGMLSFSAWIRKRTGNSEGQS